MTNQSIDIAVVGGGMVGAAAALGFAQQGFRVALIELTPPAPFVASALPDVRISAIGSASVRLLQSLGVWSSVLSMRAHPYRMLETWEQPHAHVRFSAEELQLPELGYMVENHVITLALWQALEQHDNVTLMCPQRLTGIQECGQQGWQLDFHQGESLIVPMVVGADGAQSRVRQWAGIGSSGWEYRQSCLLITCQCQTSPGESTWQHFTPSGPHAFLPLFDHWASLAWYDTPARVRQLQKMPMAQLEKALASTFPARLGTVTPIASAGFPLTRRHAQAYVRQGLALIGDAAHTIHPLAGQGVNLGYRDVKTLLEVMVAARDAGKSPYDRENLMRYQWQRKHDNLMMQSAMDLFYSGFSNRLAPVRAIRNLGLMAAERAGPVKRQALKYALGL